jgi:large subunit ribosomal protein L16
MLSPKRTRYRKQQKGRVKGLATRGHRISFGNFGLKSMEPHWITSRQIEAALGFTISRVYDSCNGY